MHLSCKIHTVQWFPATEISLNKQGCIKSQGTFSVLLNMLEQTVLMPFFNQKNEKQLLLPRWCPSSQANQTNQYKLNTNIAVSSTVHRFWNRYSSINYYNLAFIISTVSPNNERMKQKLESNARLDDDMVHLLAVIAEWWLF
jgi:hypothetical protein